MKIKVILGTARQGRYSDKVAAYINSVLLNNGQDSEIIDVKDYASAYTIKPEDADETTAKYQRHIKEAQALVIVVPEYNHSFPGELKILLDRLFLEYQGKTAYLVGVSSGSFGGARAIENLLPTLVKLNMAIKFPPLYVSNVQKIFDQKGNLTDKKQEDRINEFTEKIHEENK